MENSVYKFKDINSKIKYSFSCIYKLTSPSGKIYIGQTQSLYDRVRGYKGGKFNKYMRRAVEKYGSDSMTLEILEKDISLDKLDEREQFYLDILQPFGDKGYNICKDAGTTRGRKRPPEEMKGSIDYMTGRFGELNHFYGKKHSEETKQKQREDKLGKKQSNETIQKRVEKISKCVKQVDPITKEIIAEFSSISEASLKTNIKACNISKVANKIKNTGEGEILTYSAGGYLWIFCDSEVPNVQIKIDRDSVSKCVKQIDLETKEIIGEFPSIKIASIETGIRSTSIANVVRKGVYKKYNKEYVYKSAGGYLWESC